MHLALILAASLAAASPADPPTRQAEASVNRSLSDSGRLKELEIDVRSAYAGGRIDRRTTAQLLLGIERVRRRMFLMGMQFGYRQKVRLRARIDGLYARFAEHQAQSSAAVRSQN